MMITANSLKIDVYRHMKKSIKAIEDYIVTIQDTYQSQKEQVDYLHALSAIVMDPRAILDKKLDACHKVMVY
jgi:hypothetical protein